MWKNTMSEKNRVLMLILIMAIVALSAAGTTIALLYRAALEEESARLVETAHSQARLIEASARFDAVYGKDYPGGPEAATLSQIVDAHEQYMGFGTTGEFTLARHEGDAIVFVLSHRHSDLQNPKPVPFDSKLAEPMRRALSGLSGTVVGLDYRGESVLAAHEPVRELDLGIVAKIDLDEVRTPFLRAGVIAGSLSILVVLAGAGLFLRIGNPMVARLEGHAAALGMANDQLKLEINERKQAEEALQGAHDELEERVAKRITERVRINVELDQGLSEVFQALRKIASGDPSVRIPETSEVELIAKLKNAVNVAAKDLATIINLTHEFAMGLAEYFDVLQRVSRGDFTARVSGDSPIDLLEALKRDINQMIEDISTEIAERKRVEQALRERQASLAEAQRIAHLGNWDWNIQTNELRWSDEIYRIFGLTPKGFGATYEAFLASVHPDDRETVRKAVEDALYEEKPYSMDHRIVLPDGTERIVQEQAGITFDNEGKPIRMIGTVQDITERKRAEQVLGESEAELRHLSARLLRVQEAERETISRELHDSIGQSLAAIKFGVENCLNRIREVADRETVKSLEALVSMVRRASEEVRKIHTDLRPSLLDDLGIMATISWFCREFQELYSGVRVEQRIDIEETQVVDSLKIVIFRLLQEALNNVAKYGKGDTVRVSLKEIGGHIELAVQDNGRGFDVDQVRSAKTLKGGFGLTSMKERTELSGGSFSIESAPGAGTLVRASWPTRITKPA